MRRLHWRFARPFLFSRSLPFSQKKRGWVFSFSLFFWSVQWQVSLNKAEIYGRKGEHTDSDFPLAASHDSTYMRSFECSCQLYKSTSRPLHSSPCSVLFSPRSHRYPEQHDKNNNALFTGQYIVTVQSSLAVDLRSLGFLSVVNLWGQQDNDKKKAKNKKCSVVKTIVNCSPIRISLAGF